MGIDVCVKPVSYDWAGLSPASLAVLSNPDNYQAAHPGAVVASVPWWERPDPEELLVEQATLATAAAEELQQQLTARFGLVGSWSEHLPDPTDPDRWEDRQEYVGRLSPDGVFEVSGLAAALSEGAEGPLEALVDAWSDEQVTRVFNKGGGGYPNIFAISMNSIFVPARLPTPLVGPPGIIGSCPALGDELEMLATTTFLQPISELYGKPPLDDSVRSMVLHNLVTLTRGVGLSESLRLPMIISG